MIFERHFHSRNHIRRLAGLALSDRFSGHSLQWIWLEFSHQFTSAPQTRIQRFCFRLFCRIPLHWFWLLTRWFELPESNLIFSAAELATLGRSARNIFASTLQFTVIAMGILLSSSALNQSYLALFCLALVLGALSFYIKSLLVASAETKHSSYEVEVENLGGSLAISLHHSAGQSAVPSGLYSTEDVFDHLILTRNTISIFDLPLQNLAAESRLICFLSMIFGLLPLLILGLSLGLLLKLFLLAIYVVLVIWQADKHIGSRRLCFGALKLLSLFAIAWGASTALSYRG